MLGSCETKANDVRVMMLVYSVKLHLDNSFASMVANLYYRRRWGQKTALCISTLMAMTKRHGGSFMAAINEIYVCWVDLFTFKQLYPTGFGGPIHGSWFPIWDAFPSSHRMTVVASAFVEVCLGCASVRM